MSQKQKKIIHVPRMWSGRGGGRGGVSGGVVKTTRSNIKINVKQTAAKIKQQEDAKLRAQVEKEISWRFRVCSHAGYACTLPVLAERDYCARHILQDVSAPYRQCTHTHASGRRCVLPAPYQSTGQAEPIRREHGLCFEHARSLLASRQRSIAPPPPITTTETLLNKLQHYIKVERTRTTSCTSAVSVVSEPADDQNNPHTVLDPFKQVDARSINSSTYSGLMSACSDTDSDADSVTIGRDGSCRGGHDEDLSGDEHTEYCSHPLRYAGVFTAEEAVCEARTALRLIQTAYMRQMSRLRILLQTSRAQYLRSLRQEKEQHCSINTQARNHQVSARERRQLKKLKAYAGYHHKHGVDAVLARKLYHKRAKLNQNAPPRPPQNRCTFTEGGVRCDNLSLPATKHCLKHIMLDNQQVLYEECGQRRAGIVCLEPVPRLSVLGVGCRYHADVPNYTVFTMKKDDTDTDSDTNTATDCESQLESLNEIPSCETSDGIGQTTA